MVFSLASLALYSITIFYLAKIAKVISLDTVTLPLVLFVVVLVVLAFWANLKTGVRGGVGIEGLAGLSII